MTINEEGEQRIELLFRNGTITVVGIVLSFSLNFLTQWASNPIPWTLIDVPTVGLISAGILLQTMALLKLLKHDSIHRSKFDVATSRFIAGLITTVVGVVSAIVIDFIQLIT